MANSFTPSKFSAQSVQSSWPCESSLYALHAPGHATHFFRQFERSFFQLTVCHLDLSHDNIEVAFKGSGSLSQGLLTRTFELLDFFVCWNLCKPSQGLQSAQRWQLFSLLVSCLPKCEAGMILCILFDLTTIHQGLGLLKLNIGNAN